MIPKIDAIDTGFHVIIVFMTIGRNKEIPIKATARRKEKTSSNIGGCLGTKIRLF